MLNLHICFLITAHSITDLNTMWEITNHLDRPIPSQRQSDQNQAIGFLPLFQYVQARKNRITLRGLSKKYDLF